MTEWNKFTSRGRTRAASVALTAAMVLYAGSASAQALYGSTLTTSDATATATELNSFRGAPDDLFTGLGSHFVTYDLGIFRLIDGTGQDFNVYEVDGGGPEFNLVDILVSADNINYFNVEATALAALDLVGDEAHGAAAFRKSYDVGAAVAALGASQFRYIRIDGTGTGGIASTVGFDLDAIGVKNFIDATPPPPPPGGIPEPATWAMMLVGFGGRGAMLRRRRGLALAT